MTSPPVAFLRALRAREPQLMLGVRMSRTTDIARIAQSAGFHCLMIDLEHSSMSIDTAVALAAAAGDLGLTALVRVPEHEYGVIGRLLDGGAHGIIAPRVETADQARRIVEACRFPPRGHRSQLSQLPHRGMVPTPAATLNTAIDRETIVKILIESPLGIANIEEIAAVDGIDIIGIGANDLTSELGVPGDHDDPAVQAAARDVLAAAGSNGKLAMIGGVPLGEVQRQLLMEGMAPLFLAGIDSDLLYRASLDRAVTVAEWYAPDADKE
ncbi:aldolase/citrate lyase family protein [Microbacterium sp. 2FI]|uniref:HpcH/HpaI aldolase family protein n=1 Tax=Microbacterium sp. 2FI TaxID=2502193 RepID=UPI0010F791B8|nr:aldolase/citrate lyase family protein [Microbacterium sp. 2FI]